MGSECILLAAGIGIVAAGIVTLICLYIRREKQFRDAEAWYNMAVPNPAFKAYWEDEDFRSQLG